MRSKIYKKSGFTLVELMIVIAIVVVLAIFGSTMLIKGRTAAKSIACLNNLRQIASALEMYRSDYDELAPTLYPTLISYLKNPEIFKCPVDAGTGQDSYGAFYIARPSVDTQKLFLGCPRHQGQALALFGWPQFNVGRLATVLWNGTPVNQGTVVTGGRLNFEDGTVVEIAPGMNVGVMLSCTDPGNRLYSTICIQEGDQGQISVNHHGTSQFEVVTPSLITGVAGTKFNVLTSWGGALCSTKAECLEGTIYVEERGAVRYMSSVAAASSLEVKSRVPLTSINSNTGYAVRTPRPWATRTRIPFGQVLRMP
ncbi:MAG TPA: prepilin-type N-terminal cleavage/methylation domain-containing protein [bacterium]|uniref:FecR protein n=1 Tax=candidate division TA06 bacterium ADurb.Bin417 TaxID=1852828 RepID=A0A1V5MJJ7_UNCT6|nr:MAG: FecR protein [candidate division TA06 bacterium ADurb.Bin417]HNQ35162.1 prepilin-type N-terminal cleavage/methylation domain-containing protein [bacterium]HNS48627.1 prepilin-type N-terminal cleavage/methylation domain-containing protein [bacterium]